MIEFFIRLALRNAASPMAIKGKVMDLQRAVKIIKNGKRKVPAKQPTAECAAGPNRWSTSVKSWVSEFQKHRRDDRLPAFDSLFK